MKNLKFNLIIVACMLLLFTGCADVSPNVQKCVTSDPYGFFGGIWHGLIFPFSFIGSLFADDIAVYAYDNSGGWYDFGFLIGLSSAFGGATKTIK